MPTTRQWPAKPRSGPYGASFVAVLHSTAAVPLRRVQAAAAGDRARVAGIRVIAPALAALRPLPPWGAHMVVDFLPQCAESLRQCVVMQEETSAVAYWSGGLLGLAIGLALGMVAGLLLSDWLDERLDRWAYQRQFHADSGDAASR